MTDHSIQNAVVSYYFMSRKPLMSSVSSLNQPSAAQLNQQNIISTSHSRDEAKKGLFHLCVPKVPTT